MTSHWICSRVEFMRKEGRNASQRSQQTNILYYFISLQGAFSFSFLHSSQSREGKSRIRRKRNKLVNINFTSHVWSDFLFYFLQLQLTERLFRGVVLLLGPTVRRGSTLWHGSIIFLITMLATSQYKMGSIDIFKLISTVLSSAVNKSEQQQNKILRNAENGTQSRWLWSK